MLVSRSSQYSLEFIIAKCTACPVEVTVARGSGVNVAKIDPTIINPQCASRPDKAQICPFLARAILAAANLA